MFIKNIDILNENITYYTDFEKIDNHKPIVLFIHGFADTGTRVLPLFNKKDKEYQLISLDLPGCGKSSANTKPITIEFYTDIVNEFINKIIGDKKIYICTHSLGTNVALMLGQKRNNIKWMLLSTPAIYYNHPEEYYTSRSLDFLLPKTNEHLLATSLLLVAPSEEKSVLGPSVLQKILATPQSELDKRYETFHYLATQEIANAEYANNIIKPLWKKNKNITVVYAEFDKVITPDKVEEIVKENNIESVFVKNAGHAIFFSAPKLMNDLITKMTKEK